MRDRKLHHGIERLKEGQTPRRVLMTVIISFMGGAMAAVLINWATGWYPRIIAKLRGIDWLAWLDIPLIARYRWTWGDLALSVLAGLIVAAVVAVVRLLSRWLAHNSPSSTRADDPLAKAQRVMPALMSEMRADLALNPMRREFVILRRSWTYCGDSLAYYYDEHPDLDGQLQILLNLDLIRENTHNNVRRFVMTEQLADYLASERAV